MIGFVIGVFAGTMFGVFIMAMLQISRNDRKEEEKHDETTEKEG